MLGLVAVIGAGQFGRAVALNLARHGEAVLLVDRNREAVDPLADEVQAAMALDATDERMLVEAGIDKAAVAVVAIGMDSLEASIMTTALLRQIGVERIIARAINPLHARVLSAIGAHEVIHPEQEMGRRVAQQIVSPSIRHQLEVGDAVLAEVELPAQFVGRDLRQIDLRNRFGVLAALIKRGDEVIANPAGGEKLRAGDVIVLFGQPEAIERFAHLE